MTKEQATVVGSKPMLMIVPVWVCRMCGLSREKHFDACPRCGDRMTRRQKVIVVR